MTRFSKIITFWLLAGMILVGVAWRGEDRVDAALDVTNNPAWSHFAWWCSKLGEGEIVAGLGILLAAFFYFERRVQIIWEIIFVTANSLLIGLAGTILRILVGRTRPGLHGPKGVLPGCYGIWHDGHWIIGKAAYSAFPSGHAAVAAGLAVAVWLTHRGWGMVAAIYALAVMWSRVALQWHHLSDVIASFILAVILALLLRRFHEPLGKRFCHKHLLK